MANAGGIHDTWLSARINSSLLVQLSENECDCVLDNLNKGAEIQLLRTVVTQDSHIYAHIKHE